MDIGKIVTTLFAAVGMVSAVGGCGEGRRTTGGGGGGTTETDGGATGLCSDSPFVGKYLWQSTCEVGSEDPLGEDCKGKWGGNASGTNFSYNGTTIQYVEQGTQQFLRSFECSDVKDNDKKDCAVFFSCINLNREVFFVCLRSIIKSFVKFNNLWCAIFDFQTPFGIGKDLDKSGHPPFGFLFSIFLEKCPNKGQTAGLGCDRHSWVQIE